MEDVENKLVDGAACEMEDEDAGKQASKLITVSAPGAAGEEGAV